MFGGSGKVFFYPDLINIFIIYRGILLVLTLVEMALIFIKPNKLLRFYGKLPSRVRKFVLSQSMHLLADKVKESQKEWIFNGILLLVLLSLNVLVWTA